MISYVYVVADLHQIIDFDAGADPSCAERTPIDGGAAADFDVVADFNLAHLWKFPVLAFAEDIAEAVAADYDA